MYTIIALIAWSFLSWFTCGEIIGELQKRRELKERIVGTCPVMQHVRLYYSQSFASMKHVGIVFWGLSGIVASVLFFRKIWTICSIDTIVFWSILAMFLLNVLLFKKGIGHGRKDTERIFKSWCEAYKYVCPIICKFKDS